MSEGGEGEDEGVFSIDIMCTLIKACHWLVDNANELWISEDDKSVITTSLSALLYEVSGHGVLDWPVEQDESSVCLAAIEALGYKHDQDADMTDAMVRLPPASFA